jgi:hypothetical protein
MMEGFTNASSIILQLNPVDIAVAPGILVLAELPDTVACSLVSRGLVNYNLPVVSLNLHASGNLILSAVDLTQTS